MWHERALMAVGTSHQVVMMDACMKLLQLEDMREDDIEQLLRQLQCRTARYDSRCSSELRRVPGMMLKLKK